MLALLYSFARQIVPLFTRILSYIPSLFFFIFILNIITVIHELGHYLACYYTKIHVEKFKVGFGKELYSYKDSLGTTWSLGLFPILGYIIPAYNSSSDIPAANSHSQIHTNKQSVNTIDSASYMKKSLIYLAGPVSNFILTFILFFTLFTLRPPLLSSTSSNTYLIPLDSYNTSTKSYNHFFAISDTISNIHNNNTSSCTTQSTVSSDSVNTLQQTSSSVDNKTIITTAHYRPQYIGKTKLNIGSISISTDKTDNKSQSSQSQSSTSIESESPLSNTHHNTNTPSANTQTTQHTPVKHKPDYSAKVKISKLSLVLKTMKTFCKQFIEAITTSAVKNISGPIGIYKQISSSSITIIMAIFYIATLSFSIGLFNLLPFPGLDGYQFTIASIEKLTGKTIYSKILEYIEITLLISIFVFALGKDIYSLISLDRIKQLLASIPWAVLIRKLAITCILLIVLFGNQFIQKKKS